MSHLCGSISGEGMAVWISFEANLPPELSVALLIGVHTVEVPKAVPIAEKTRKNTHKECRKMYWKRTFSMADSAGLSQRQLQTKKVQCNTFYWQEMAIDGANTNVPPSHSHSHTQSIMAGGTGIKNTEILAGAQVLK